ncbi:hypothetical protein Acr_10g0006200 [Actinidia rufa]|uniref:Uncharacterized protein n=1 Tax=Actinidia rufa TaxID=165716 RepID=A0A7J0F983_9ERIC|nr:hypothetical protein Acr_10g0006200 [Actinidia rufa]
MLRSMAKSLRVSEDEDAPFLSNTVVHESALQPLLSNLDADAIGVPMSTTTKLISMVVAAPSPPLSRFLCVYSAGVSLSLGATWSTPLPIWTELRNWC